MNHSGLKAAFKLSHAPISNYEFAILKGEDATKDTLKGSMLYVIAQRHTLTFENVVADPEANVIRFEIAQDKTNNKVSCTLPVGQEILVDDCRTGIEIQFGSHNTEAVLEEMPLSEVHGMKFYDSDKNFLSYLNPDKFIFLYSNSLLNATIEGDYRSLVEFRVHYVGKATDQEIWDRLNGHETLQDILSIERPMGKTIPTHEIILLMFKVADSLEMNIFDPGDDPEIFAEKIMNSQHPTSEVISLDAEKALVNLLNPAYNTVKFKQFPKSKDGLFKFNYNRYAYQILEDITLASELGTIFCSVDENISDIIAVDKKNGLEIISLRSE